MFAFFIDSPWRKEDRPYLSVGSISLRCLWLKLPHLMLRPWWMAPTSEGRTTLCQSAASLRNNLLRLTVIAVTAAESDHYYDVMKSSAPRPLHKDRTT
ncbi:hypothetical protein ASF69_11715 [Rhizobium sp. Leaf311]|nr:hypothetical protein ASF69_11715 [Rhizobium sp. Leaf311]